MAIGDGTTNFTNALTTEGPVVWGDDATTALLWGAGAASSSTVITTATASKNFVQFYTKSTATSGDSRGYYHRHYLAGAGISGEAARLYTTVNNVAAGTAHGAHISLSFGTTGSITGQGIAMRATLHVPNQAQTGGTYAGGQSEIYYDGASSNIAGSTVHSIHRFIQDGNATAYAKALNVFEFVNLSTGSGKMYQSESLRFIVNGSARYNFLSTDQNAFTLGRTLTSQSTESSVSSLTLSTDSSFIGGSDVTYSGGYGSSILKMTGTYTGTAGGFNAIYSAISTSGAIGTAGAGVVGIKSVVTNTGAVTDGSFYGGQFIAKHNHATNAMAAEAALIGLESWGYVSAAGCANTVIGLNTGWHNEATGGNFAGGSVIRGIQVFCDNNAGGNDPDESTGICLWNQAGTITNAFNVVNSGSGFTNFLTVSSAAGFAAYAAGGYTPGSVLGYLTVKVGANTQYIALYNTMTPI